MKRLTNMTDYVFGTYSDMEERLMDIEDILDDEYDLDHLKELVQADREGRIEIIEPDVYECIKTVRKAQATLQEE